MMIHVPGLQARPFTKILSYNADDLPAKLGSPAVRLPKSTQSGRAVAQDDRHNHLFLIEKMAVKHARKIVYGRV